MILHRSKAQPTFGTGWVRMEIMTTRLSFWNIGAMMRYFNQLVDWDKVRSFCVTSGRAPKGQHAQISTGGRLPC